ncbi:PAS domain S-box protein [Mycolicibacterium sp.]|uniref:PAS domain S-box protein n=1 Tax=Mycolicibacterium sp. TaxID=2320850 RepID=UPI001A32964E|nr:PAS domain S-box protein [Mycolicibacterium sp.]MBJ7339813.1 PAS domain S-box protein [Mycolicibacterium sp.]
MPIVEHEQAERDRLRVLVDFAIMDTPAEAAFDDLAALAAHLCGAPMALVSLVDADRQWFKARHGLSVSQTPREQSFCAHALRGTGLLVVPDTRLDPRFVDNPLVTGEPHLRFYAGAPLVTSDGYVLGTLCVLGGEPRQLTELQGAHLKILAAQVVSQLELRRQARRLAFEVQARLTADAALREQQRMLDVILEHTDVLIYAKDLDGRFVLTNPALERITQVDGGLHGRTDHDLFPADVAGVYRNNDVRIVGSRERQVFSEDLVHPDGSTHTYRSTKFPLVDDAGLVIGIGGVSTDVTELVAARAAHQEAEQRWRALVEQSPIAVVVVEADTRIVYANPEAVALFGLSTAAEVEQRPAVDFVPGDAGLETVAMIDGILSSGVPLRDRWPVQRIDGTQVTVEFDASAVTYRGAPAVQFEFRDITSAAVAHAALTESERRFRAVFDDSPVAMALVDLHGRWVQVNAAFGRLTGIVPAQAVGRLALSLVHHDDHHLLLRYDHEGLGRDGSGQEEMRIVRCDGELRWVWVSTKPTPGPDGEVLILAVIQDVTARKTAERALLESEADLAAVAAIARCAHTGSDPRSVVVTTVRELAEACTVSMLEAVDADTLVVTASAGLDVVGVTLPLAATSVTSHVWRTGELVFLPDAAADPRVDHRLLSLDGSVSLLSHPVVIDGRVEAILNVTWRHRVPDSAARAVRSVQTIANETGAALQTSRLRDELEDFAATDPLTGAMNRRAWDTRLQALADGAVHGDLRLVIAVVDLDNFKSYNDTHGHGVGDLLLRDFAAATRAALRPGDVFARWGGEEFVIALPGTTLDQAARILDRIRAVVPAAQTCSIGYTEWDAVEPLARTIARADAALYQAKARGRDQLARA